MTSKEDFKNKIIEENRKRQQIKEESKEVVEFLIDFETLEGLQNIEY